MIAQLFKIFFIIAFAYMLFNLVRVVFRIGSVMREKRRREEEQIRQEGPRPGPSGPRKGKQVIELEKDQYRVE